MNKIVKISLLIIVIAFNSKAQINYNFSGVNGSFTYNTSPTQLHASAIDDAISAATNIGFTFQYGCNNYTQFKASTNGWLTFNTGITVSSAFNDLSGTTNLPIIAPLWDDLETGTGGEVNYKLTGTAPNRVLTVEWKQMNWNYAATTWALSFQVKLYETTNRIEFVYDRNGNAGANINSASASIGLTGLTTGDFYSLDGVGGAPNASKVTETDVLSSKPATGQIYRWDPVTCSGAPTAGSAACTPSISCGTFTSNLSLTGTSAGCGITYQWQSSAAVGGPYSNIAGATGSTLNVTNTSTTYYRCVLSCSGATAASTPATASIIAVGSCAICNQVNVASLPFTLNGQTTCGQGNNVTSANASTVCGSSSYYGGEDATYAFTPSSSGAVNISVTSSGTWMGITLYNGCPISGGTCVGNAQSSLGNQTLCVTVTAGQTYYLVIDSYPSPTCNPYNVSISAPGLCSGVINGVTASASPTYACGSLSTNLSLSGYSGCGITFQWQSSPASAGPYTNISGATTANYALTTTVATTYYRAVLTCGSSTAASSVVQTSVTQSGATSCPLSTYTAATTAFNFENFSGTLLPTTDDVLFNAVVNFGFAFCFGGSQYSGGYVASNSAFVFDAVTCYPNIQTSTYAAGGVSTGYTISGPAPILNTSVPRNAILAPWHDILPNSTATVATSKIQYTTLGTAPNRRFIVSYEDIPMFSSACQTVAAQRFSGQIKLFETTNAIEIHIKNKQVCSTWNNGQAIMGLHSFDGTTYIPPVNATAHNATSATPYNQWTMTNTAYKFQSPCAFNVGVCSVLPIGFKDFYGEQIDHVNRLYWETSEESNIKEFIIERSTDAVNFKEIGYVLPNNKPSKYKFNDNAFRPGIMNYYKITAVEYNGKRKSTFIYPLGESAGDLTVSDVFPNPGTGNFNVTILAKEAMNVTVYVKDMFGRVVKSSTHDTSVGYSALSLESPENTGLYIVEVVNTLSQRILSQQKLVISK